VKVKLREAVVFPVGRVAGLTLLLALTPAGVAMESLDRDELSAMGMVSDTRRWLRHANSAPT
jgi:hypothetical protein